MSLEIELREAATMVEQHLEMFGAEFAQALGLMVWATREASLDTRMLAQMQRHKICAECSACVGCPFESIIKSGHSCTTYCEENPNAAYDMGRRYLEK